MRLSTDAERGRPSGFPKDVPAEDAYAFFTLTGPDSAAIPATSAPANRPGFALSLRAVRYLGFRPEDLRTVPEKVAWYVGNLATMSATHGTTNAVGWIVSDPAPE